LNKGPRRETAGGISFEAGISMVAHLTSGSHGLGELVQLDRHAFAAKIRLSRAVLGWSQSELGRRIGLTQRAIHKLEQGETQPRRSTVRALEEIWRDHDIKFENLAAGGFRVSIPPSALDRPEEALRRHRRRRNVHN
jgi:transcriptional regulator with XRE-family HTH domain